MTSRRRSARPELMDDPELPAEAAERALSDLNRVNRWLLGILPVRRALLPRLRYGPTRQLLLDLGSGSGQVPAAIARAARRRKIVLRVVGVDRKIGHLIVGRRQGFPAMRVAASADRLPFRDRSFEWSLSTLFFHHFDAESNRRIVGEMRRVASRAAVIVDLRRSPLALALLRALLPLLRVGPVAFYDGKLSVAQAWTMSEVRGWLGGGPVEELRRRFPFRFSLVLPARSDASAP